MVVFSCFGSYILQSNQGRRQLREIGGTKLKSEIRGAKVFAKMRRLFLAEITNFPTKSKKKGFRRNPKAFSGRNHKFSDQKQVISKQQKKRSSGQNLKF